jgi:hypothetical protein
MLAAATAEAANSPHILDAGYCRHPLVLPPRPLLVPIHTGNLAYHLSFYSGYQRDRTARSPDVVVVLVGLPLSL